MPAFDDLIPDLILDAVEEQQCKTSGSLIALNSYENRVYQVGLDDGRFVVIKFYRPGRWNESELATEHDFVNKLADKEIPVVPAMRLPNPAPGHSCIGKMGSYYYAIWPRFRGRLRDDLMRGDREILGRLLARMHLLGEKNICRRPAILDFSILENIAIELCDHEVIPSDLKQNLQDLVDQLLDGLYPLFDRDWQIITTHGDCHHGNVLWNEDGAFLVDFDDLAPGPSVQDMWMLFYGDAQEKRLQQEEFFQGYETFRKFDHSEMLLCEALRARRMLQHAHWLGGRWQEAVFKQAFPYFSTRKFWEELTLNLREQIALIHGYE